MLTLNPSIHKPVANYPDWVQSKTTNFYINLLTGESTIWHPAVVTIASPLYHDCKKWCRKASDDANKQRKPIL